MDTLVGTIERVTYQSDETGYTVAKMRPELRLCETHERLTTVTSRDGLLAVIGNMAALAAGERLELRGYWVSHAQYGRQFKIIEYKTLFPATVEGIPQPGLERPALTSHKSFADKGESYDKACSRRRAKGRHEPTRLVARIQRRGNRRG